MASGAHPYIDIAVMDMVRDRLSAGDAVLIVNEQLDSVIFANAAGARLAGFDNPADLTGSDPELGVSARRQIGALDFEALRGKAATIALRLASGVHSAMAMVSVSPLVLPDGSKAVMLSAPSEGGIGNAIEGLASDGSHAAILDATGGIVISSKAFASLSITEDELARLAADASGERDRMVKRRIRAGNAAFPAGIGRIGDAPALFILLVIEQAMPLEIPAAPDVPAPVFGKRSVPVQEAAPMDRWYFHGDRFSGSLRPHDGAGPRNEHANESKPAAPLPTPQKTSAAEAAAPAKAGPEPAKSEPASRMAEMPRMAADPDATPVRFTWKIDAAGIYSMISPEFGEAVGSGAADVVGRTFAEVAQAFAMDPAGEIRELLERHDTWSGRTVLWPIEGTDLRAPVDLAALPVYDRDRRFEGFRGFGIVRLADAVLDPESIGLALTRNHVPASVEAESAAVVETLAPQTSAPTAPPAVSEWEAADIASPDVLEPQVTESLWTESEFPAQAEFDAGDKSDGAEIADDESADHDPWRGEVPALDISTPKPVVPLGEKVIRLEERRQPRPQDNATESGLSPVERSAFREIAERLRREGLIAPVQETARNEDPAGTTDVADLPSGGAEPGKIEPLPQAPAGIDFADPSGNAAVETAEDLFQPVDAAPEYAASASAYDSASDQSADATAELPDVESLEIGAADPNDGIFADPIHAAHDEVSTEEPPLAIIRDDEALTAETAASTEASDEADCAAAADIAANEGPSDLAETEGYSTVADPDLDDDTDLSDMERLDASEGLETGSSEATGFELSDGTPDDGLAADFAEVSEANTEAAPDLLQQNVPVEAEADARADAELAPLLDEAPILSRLPVPILVHTGSDLLFANQAFLDLTGYATLAALKDAGGLDRLFVQPEDRPDQTPSVNSLLRTAYDEKVPVRAHLHSVPWKGGHALLLSMRPLDASAGQSAPIESEQLAALRQEVSELSSVLETATDGVVFVNQDGTIRAITQSAEALFGFDPAEVKGKPFATLFATESQRAVGDYLANLSGTGVASLMNDGREVIGREAHGRFVPLFMTIGRLSGSTGYCAVMRDITQWKRAEEELSAARRAAEHASSQKSEFLARVSHEIRTPLNAIIGFSDLMTEERFGPVGNMRYLDYLKDINRSGRHVLDLVNDLLDISKIEAGQQEMDFEAVALNESLAEAVSMMQPQANRNRVIIRSSFASDLPDVVADLRSVKQIALNLLSNAVRYTAAGGQVIVSTAYELTGGVVIRVRDTGIGMTAQEIEQAMKPFKQINALNRGRGEGTGLGLPLTKAMVEANRANFSITSTPGQGTLVEVTFPSTRVLAD